MLIGYGIVSRVLKTAAEKLQERGIKAGLFRPISLFPFPSKEIAALADRKCRFFVVELSNGQMLEDVKLAVSGRSPIDFYNRMGGVVPTTEEVIEQAVKNLAGSN